MTRNEKKAVIESMAEKFMNIDDLEGEVNDHHGDVCVCRG